MAETEQAVDAVVITGDDVLADPTFARALGQLDKTGLHVGGVDREGRFRLYAAKSGQRRPLCDVRMSLDEILATRGPATPPLIDARRTIAPPAILSVRPFPLRLSHQLDVQRAWAVKGHGVFSLTHDRRLLHWNDGQEGGRQLADDLPVGNLHWAAVAVDDGTAHAVVGKLSRDGLYLLSIDLERMQCEVKRLALGNEGPRSVASHQGAVFVLFDDYVVAFSRDPLGHSWVPTNTRKDRVLRRDDLLVSSNLLLADRKLRQQDATSRFDGLQVSLRDGFTAVARLEALDRPVRRLPWRRWPRRPDRKRSRALTPPLKTVKQIQHGFGPIKLLATSRRAVCD